MFLFSNEEIDIHRNLFDHSFFPSLFRIYNLVRIFSSSSSRSTIHSLPLTSFQLIVSRKISFLLHKHLFFINEASLISDVSFWTFFLSEINVPLVRRKGLEWLWHRCVHMELKRSMSANQRSELFYCAIQSDPALIWTYSSRLISRRMKICVHLFVVLFQGIAHSHHQQTCQRANRWVSFYWLYEGKKSFIKTFSLNSKQILRSLRETDDMINKSICEKWNMISFSCVCFSPLQFCCE